MRKLSLGFALLFLLQIGASAPQSSVAAKQSSPASPKSKVQKSFSSVATPQSMGDQIVKYFGRKTGKELMTEKAGSVNIAKKTSPKTKEITEKPPLPKDVQSLKSSPAMKSGYVPLPPKPRVAVPQIRQEIQRILELNKQIKNVQKGSSVQLQRVQEQARIHQKILNALESSQKLAASQKAPSRSALLSQEKIRIIHEETKRNAQMVEDLKAIPTGSATKMISKETPKVMPKVASKEVSKAMPKVASKETSKVTPKVQASAS